MKNGKWGRFPSFDCNFCADPHWVTRKKKMEEAKENQGFSSKSDNGLCCGPKRNAKCEAVGPDNQPIWGLYSAGKLGSFWGWMCNGGRNNAEALRTGRIAARNILAQKSG